MTKMRDWLRHVPLKEPDKIIYENGCLIVQWNEVHPEEPVVVSSYSPSGLYSAGSSPLTRCVDGHKEPVTE